MAIASLLTLLDDISVILDDVSVMTKVAAKKTAGVLGDDLALNANQVSGVRADRELPVVWSVAKGSLVNKVILVPLALIISAISQTLVTGLLMIGGLYLCYEGAEKVVHKFWPHPASNDPEQAERLAANADESVDLVAHEKEKIKGAVRTDFILSAEIIVISLGTIAATVPLLDKAATLVAISLLMTVGVYGFVAMIVKIDDFGLHLQQKSSSAAQSIGKALLAFAPILMKVLSIAGTLAMFLVGGGILAHGVSALYHGIEHLGDLSGAFSGLTTNLLNGLVGLVAGLVVVAIMTVISKIRNKPAH
ncbi:hypothetical protein B8W92_03370 [Moraxella osloensis]|nr:DUF808 domain-containing protein [Moraxella osloensis]PAL17051.1 hypothetical protein B8W92_03370 [Moraxella osloensis]